MQPTATMSPAQDQVAVYRSAAMRSRLAIGVLAAYLAANGLLLLGWVVGVVGVPRTAAANTAAAWTIQLLVIASIVTYLFWLHRVVGNMPALGTTDSVWSAGRAVAWCFVPFGFVVQPMWSVLDAWRGADTSARRVALKSPPPQRVPWILVAWWLFWLLVAFGGLVGSRASGALALTLNAIAGFSAFAAALLCILVIRDVTDRQERKHELIASGVLS